MNKCVSLVSQTTSTMQGIILLLLVSVLLLMITLALVIVILQIIKEVRENYRSLQAEWTRVDELKRHVTEMFHHLCVLFFGRNVRTMIRNNVRHELNDQFAEEDRRREKRANVIIHGLRETGARDLDEDLVNDVLGICDERIPLVNLFERFGVIGPHRQPRPIRVRLSSSYRKARVLHGASSGLDQIQEYRHVRITEDLTQRQEREQQLRHFVVANNHLNGMNYRAAPVNCDLNGMTQRSTPPGILDLGEGPAPGN